MILEDRGLGGVFFSPLPVGGENSGYRLFEGLLGNDERRRVNQKSVSLVRGNKTGGRGIWQNEGLT